MELTPMQPFQEVTRPSQEALTSMNHLKANLPPAQTGLVSVIIPAYNGEKYITQAVESVLNQTYSNYEILVVDDGSTDNTRGVLEPYLDKIQYVYQENQGVAVARNRGIEMARGELVAFLDQDDFFLSHKLALQVACFELQPSLGMVHSGWRRVNATREKIADAQLWKDVPNLDLEGWVLWRCVLLSAMMFRREWLERVGGLDPQFKQTDDVDLILRLILMGCQTAWVRQSVVCYREHEGNASRNIPVQAKENLAVLDKFFVLQNLPEPIQKLENHCRYYTTLWIAFRFYLAGLFSEMAEYLKQSLNYLSDDKRESAATELNWLKTFTDMSGSQGEQFDITSLKNCPEWIQLQLDLELKQLRNQFSQIQEELERFKGQLHQKNQELAQSQAELHQAGQDFEQVQSQLGATTEQLAQMQAEFQQQTQELEQFQAQLRQKSADLEQCQSFLHQTEKVLEQSQEQLQQSRESAQQFESQLHHTQEELEQSQSQLYEMTQERDCYQSQLHHTQEELEQSQSQLYEMTQERDHYQSQLHHTQEELEQSQSQLHQKSADWEECQSVLHQTEEVLEQSQSQLHETEKVLEQSLDRLQQSRERTQQFESQLQQTQKEFQQSQSQLHEMTQERERYQSQLHQTQEELEQSESQQQQTQEELALMQTEKDWLDSQVLAWTQTAQQVQEQFERENIWLKAQSQAWMQAAQQCHQSLQ